MFTGLVEQVGKVESAEDRRGQRRIQIQTKFSDLALGESISINGVCLTVAEVGAKGEALFFVSEETLERSTLGKLEAGSKVNLERALQIGDRMGGHWVQGHVDVKAMVLNSVPGADHHRITIAMDSKYGRYCVEKGSISVDGVSLTINKITQTRNKEFMVSFLVIPHTWKHTTLSELKTGDSVNIEVDILAKYIEKMCPQLDAVKSFMDEVYSKMPSNLPEAMAEAAASSAEAVTAPEAAQPAAEAGIAPESSLEADGAALSEEVSAAEQASVPVEEPVASAPEAPAGAELAPSWDEPAGEAGDVQTTAPQPEPSPQ